MARYLTTAGDIKRLLREIPNDTPVRFSPISPAWLGTDNPMRCGHEVKYYKKRGAVARRHNKTAYAVIYIFEGTKTQREEW